MRKLIRQHWKLAATGYSQVLLVVVNQWQIAHEKYFGAVLVAFCISLIWTFNIRAVVFGSWTQRLVYSLSAALGTATGLALTKIIY